MGILIDTVRIHNFRSLKNIEVKLSPFTLLVGMNNSGKTSFLKALQLALGVEKQFITLDDFFISRKTSKNKDNEIFVDILIVPVDDKYKRKSTFDDNWVEQFGNNFLRFDAEDNQYVAFRTQIRFDSLKNEFIKEKFPLKEWPEKNGWEKIEIKKEPLKKLDSIPLFFIDAHRDIFDDLKDRSSYLGKLVSKIEFSTSDIEKIEKQLDELNRNVVGSSDVLTHLKKRLELLNNTISNNRKGIEITPYTKKLRDINKGLNIHFQDNESESFSIEYHGLGTRSWASLLTFSAFITWRSEKAKLEDDSPFHPILALEEPEAHLHPDGQRYIYNQLKEIEGQKIVSTHSPFLAGQCTLDEIRHFYKKEEEAIINTIDLSDLKDEEKQRIEREIVHSRGELLFARAVILGEGITEEQALPVFARKYWDRHPFELGLNFIGVGGNSNYSPFLKLLDSLNIEWFILSDGEPQTKTALRKQLKSINNKDTGVNSNVFYLESRKNFEDYLINQGYISELIQAIDNAEGENYFDRYIKKKDGKEGRSEKTDKICPECKQYIYSKLKYNYSGDEGTKQALSSCLKEGKTKYSRYIAEVITNHVDESKHFPTVIKELFDAVETIIRSKKGEGNKQ